MSLDVTSCSSTKPVPPVPPSREARRLYSGAIFICVVGLIIWSAIGTGTDLRVFFHRDAWFQMATFVSSLFPPDLSWGFLRSTLWSGVETIALSLMGTVLAVLIALPLGIISSRTVLIGSYAGEGQRFTPSTRLLRMFPYWGSTAVLNMLRSIPELLGKLFSEVIEDVNPQPLEALQASGAPMAAVLAYGIFPMALPQLLSYTLYRWEVNIRAAAIIGVVGAGGIGREIYVAVSLFHYQQLLTLLLMTLAIVTVVDNLSAWVRSLQRV
jgi:phosphonate transport system permease protein